MQLLLDAKANPLVLNKKNEDLLTLAERRGRQMLMPMLEKAIKAAGGDGKKPTVRAAEETTGFVVGNRHRRVHGNVQLHEWTFFVEDPRELLSMVRRVPVVCMFRQFELNRWKFTCIRRSTPTTWS